MTEMTSAVSIDEIQRAVCEFFDVSMINLKAQNRHLPLARYRQVAMYLARKHTLASYPTLATAFKRWNHVTVLHACRSIERLAICDPSLASSIRALEAKLGVGVARLDDYEAAVLGEVGL